MGEITDEAREIAIAWIENYKPMGFDIQGKHKLASDIMNYSNEQLEKLIDAIIERLIWHIDNGEILDEVFIKKELETFKPK